MQADVGDSSNSTALEFIRRALLVTLSAIFRYFEHVKRERREKKRKRQGRREENWIVRQEVSSGVSPKRPNCPYRFPH